MSKLACVALLSFASFVASLGTGCATATDDDGGESSVDALSTVTAQECKKPTVTTAPQVESGAPVEGSAHTTLSGCVAGAAGETGADVIERVVGMLADTQKLTGVKDTTGAPVFTKFKAGKASGSLASGHSQDIDVTLAMDHAPTTRLHIEQKKLANGSYAVEITNATALSATVAFFNVTVVKPGDLELTLRVKPEANGVVVSGTADIILQQEQAQASKASLLVSDLFGWLSGELSSH
jgi:hypothetical protein